jgi:hypothetical protein
MWRARFERGFGSVVRQTAKWMNEWTYNVTLRSVRANVVIVEERCYVFFVYVCSLNYRAWNAHAPYCPKWPVWFYIFPHYLMNEQDLRKKKVRNKKCVLIFSTSFVWNISHSTEKWVRYDPKCS